MNKHLVLVPLALLGIFLLFHRGAEQAIAQRKAAHVARLDREKKLADETRTRHAQLAAAQASRQLAERERHERAQAEKKRADHEAALAKIALATAVHRAAAADLDGRIHAAETQLAALETRKAEVDRAAFELARDVARRRVAGRTAEIELQRAIAIVAQRLNASDWAKEP